ncbi:MAG: hypothetical protein PHV34_22540 [Verrucomicrobiae bacterium]|nr:hypothetical protein [Verrucomicrobiae bacterium]
MKSSSPLKSINYSETLLTEKNRTPPKAVIRVDKDPIHTPTQGIGINITLDGQAKDCYPDTPDQWKNLLSQLSDLSPNWLCLTLPAQEVLTEKGELIKDSPIMRQFDHFCRWANDNKVDVDLMFPKSAPTWMRFQGLRSHSPAPRDLDAYANMIAEAWRYFIKDKNYHCLKYATIFGEPFNEDGGDFSFGTPDGSDPYAYYIKMHETVRKAFDKQGLQQVGLMGPNSADVYAHLESFARTRKRKLDLAAPLAAIDLHTYRMRPDYMPPSHHIFTLGLTDYIEHLLKETVQGAKKAGKPCYITELGCMYYGKSVYGDNRGPSRHECFIAEAELIVRAFNLGMDGILKWVLLFNTTQLRGHYHLLELQNGAYVRKENYHGFSLLNRCQPKGTKVLKTELSFDAETKPHCWTAAFLSPDGQLSIAIINDHPTNLVDAQINLDPAFAGKPLHHWVVDTWDKKVRKGTAGETNGPIQLRLTPLSLTVLTTAP